MSQLLGAKGVPLASFCIERDEDGYVVRLKPPFVLAGSHDPSLPQICKIEENRVTIVSKRIRDLLATAEPTIEFSAVGFEDEAVPVEVPKPVRIPSREELMGGRGRREN